jgi:AAA+ ATPase superfamily predicted ATPase
MRAPRAEPFVDREREARALDAQYRAAGGRLVVVIGRRRLGKTELLTQFCRGKEAALIFCPRSEPSAAYRALLRDLAQAFGGLPPGGESANGAEGFAQVVADVLTARARRVVVLDEFQNLAALDPAILSFLQREWDRRLRDGHGMLVLCGSAVGMMEDFALSSTSPLYGRQTSLLRLLPLPFWSTGALIPEKALGPRLLRFAVTGGVPHYLRLMRPFPRLEDALRATVFDAGGALREEPLASVVAETREPGRYLSVLDAVANGASRLTEIADRTGIALTTLPPYMDTLVERLKLVERRTVITDQRANSRNSHYRIGDPFFRFWFSSVAPARSRLERGEVEGVLSEAVARLPHLAAPVLEDVVRDALLASWGTRWGKLEIRFDRAGAWWNRRGDEIDIVAMGPRRQALAAEVKLGGRPVDASAVLTLSANAEKLPLAGPVNLAVVTAGAFTTSARRAAKGAGVHLIDGPAFQAILRSLPRRPPQP